MGTKGTWRRPAQISEAELAQRWDQIFQCQPAPELEPERILEGESYTVRTRYFPAEVAPPAEID